MAQSAHAFPPSQVSASISLNWQRRGAVKAYTRTANGVVSWEKVYFEWPFVRNNAGLYRITIMGADDYRWIYIGEAAYISRRLRAYQRLHKSKPDSTSSRLTVLLRKALLKGLPVYLDTASWAKLAIGGAERRILLEQMAE